MIELSRASFALVAILAFVSCATAQTTETPSGTGNDAGTTTDSSSPSGCDGPCDKDGDGIADGIDKCPGTLAKAPVNKQGCSDSQLTPKLEPTFPPFGLTWTPTGSLGRAGGLTWTYTGINRADLFHVYWIVCDDPSTPCGLSLDGPIDLPAEKWQFSATDSDLTNGKLVLTNATGILLASTTTTPLTGRLTITIVDASDAPVPFVDVSTLGVTARDGKHGAEIKGTGYKVVALGEVMDTTANVWTPYLDYYEAAPTPDTGDAGGNVYTSFGASFYSK
ncbi:hypothetical protein BH09MYX1_BH09MYX1_40510 [soil metagenome]